MNRREFLAGAGAISQVDKSWPLIGQEGEGG